MTANSHSNPVSTPGFTSTVGRRGRGGFTLIELLLAIGLLVVLAALATPNLVRQIEDARFPESAKEFRALLEIVRVHAMMDGLRYRIRFPEEDIGELDRLKTDVQPIIEREDDPVEFPEEFNRVNEPWTLDATFKKGVWCVEVRLGRPRIDRSFLEDGETESIQLVGQDSDFDEDRPPLYFEPDGVSDWATFVLTSAPRETSLEEIKDVEKGHPVIEVIIEGPTGQVWLQRPFHDEELDMLAENGWPPVLRQDFLRRELLTEDDVLEINERSLRK
jgi:prepilin-type N-terminal cleavage/methylation domain-containing protein